MLTVTVGGFAGVDGRRRDALADAFGDGHGFGLNDPITALVAHRNLMLVRLLEARTARKARRR